uniref:Uncharacterized protein n=1 Tax=Candidatus Methanogaster sp. ANME-2c ERB4 TaxID=2759911 RepID=A0A7G9Y8Q5_9EURY|nr:hypothetical protein DGMLNGLO_00001 [Methanosarcinales archaeon ANME-2c ERB4]
MPFSTPSTFSSNLSFSKGVYAAYSLGACMTHPTDAVLSFRRVIVNWLEGLFIEASVIGWSNFGSDSSTIL